MVFYVDFQKDDLRVTYVAFKHWVSSSQETNCVSINKSIRLLLFKETIVIYADNYMQPKNILWAKFRALKC
jgi:hypothetical protein